MNVYRHGVELHDIFSHAYKECLILLMNKQILIVYVNTVGYLRL